MFVNQTIVNYLMRIVLSDNNMNGSGSCILIYIHMIPPDLPINAKKCRMHYVSANSCSHYENYLVPIGTIIYPHILRSLAVIILGFLKELLAKV